VLSLKHSTGLDEGNPLLLELRLRLLTRGLFLTMLLLRRGEHSGLVRQASLQPLGLLGFLLGQTLPSPRSLEGRAILLELGTNRGHLSLPLRRHGARPRQVFPRLVQRLVPVHERRLHPLDRGNVLRSLGVQLWRLIPQGLRPVHQPPVRGPQGLDEGVEGVVLPPVPVELGVQAVEGVILLPGAALQILPLTGKARKDGGQERHRRGRNKGKNHETR
jgi:hypothetical protein